MKIGIDCRMYGLKHAGIGRYVENLVKEVLKQDNINEYVLFVRNDFEEVQKLKFKNQNFKSKFKIINADFPHYSLKEQVFFPAILNKENLDLMHFPHFNVPIFYRGKYIVTIHDLIKHTSKGMQTTTKNAGLYWLKYFGYKLVFSSAVKRAKKIITPSRFVREEIIKEYKINPQKIEVTYEGFDQKIQNQEKEIFKKYQIEKPFLLYVGSVYPHKNVENLIKAVVILNQEHHPSFPKIILVIICGRNVFWQRLQSKIKEMKAENLIKMTDFVPDEELGSFYREALAFTFPSLSEGFGLPGLEAMANSLPLICSDVPVFHEIYQGATEYFNPHNPEDMAKKINEVISNEKIKNSLIKKGLERVKNFSWQKMASQTIRIYNSVW